MGVVIWYRVLFEVSGVPIVAASNDVFSGNYLLDTDITVSMAAGEAADTVTAVLTNLPADVAEGLKTAQQEGAAAEAPLMAEVYLGYFDEPQLVAAAKPVIRAVVTSVETEVAESGLLVTSVKGTEEAGYRLLRTDVTLDRAGIRSRLDVMNEVAQQAKVKVVGVVPGTVKDYTQKTKAIAALRELAAQAEAPLVVRDGEVRVGGAVGVELWGVMDAKTNLVSLTRAQEVQPVTDPAAQPGTPPKSKPASFVDVTVLGHPDLRVGMTVQLRPRDPVDLIPGLLRVNAVTHKFNTSSGYTCSATLVVAQPGALAEVDRGAGRVVRRMRDVAESTRDQRLAIDVGQVTSYDPGSTGKHLATLAYGQSPPVDAVAPSVEQPVNQTPTLHSKPMVSPFAWHKCGLVVPVYPGMRALLAHNRGLTNDALVAGFVWSENPKHDRPKSNDGDYWLCLPTQVAATGPTGNGVNDLIAKDGMRTIDAKALRIAVGDGKLKPVGDRPDVPGDKTLVIEHESGTTITVGSEGDVTIATKGKKITLATGDNADVTIDGSSMIIKGLKVAIS